MNALSPTVVILIVLAVSYLIGSVPFAVIVSKAMGLQDPRSFGSGNPGATNVLRSGSKLAALLTLIGDAGKGAVAVLVVRALFASEPIAAQQWNGFVLGLWLVAAAAIGSFLGHVFSFFLKGKGGKGVATAAGVLLALDWRMGLAVLVCWITIAFVTRYSSLAALGASVAAASISAYLWGVHPLTVAVWIMIIIMVARHHENIKKLMNGTESKLGSGAKKA
jgi:acyl phosphate:glycerol-3-phosphate acyltransferase